MLTHLQSQDLPQMTLFLVRENCKIRQTPLVRVLRTLLRAVRTTKQTVLLFETGSAMERGTILPVAVYFYVSHTIAFSEGEELLFIKVNILRIGILEDSRDLEL